jgi:hypothetical protein
MRFKTTFWLLAVIATAVLLLSSVSLVAQETTGGLQGTIKDSSGAVVANAHVAVTGTTLVGSKALDTDASGYYRFANLPPGVYTITVTAPSFKITKREGVNLEVGHLPTLDITLEVGAKGEVVEVTTTAPVIDTTTNVNQTNLTQEALQDQPHGYSFQSVIQYAPMARNEPLAGGSAGTTGNSGGSLPGSAGNGNAVGFSVGGAADSENSYLVEGQDTENIAGGASQANVPFQFIQEVQIKSSGIEAEHGGALGGVINVVMKKGSNGYHGSFFGSYESNSLDGGPNATLRYDPLGSPVVGTANGPGFDAPIQDYQPRKDHFRIVQPGFTVGGPIMKDRVWFFLGFAPQYNSTLRTVNFGAPIACGLAGGCPSSALGNQGFTRDIQQYFSTARLDATLNQKIRVFGSWLYQYERESGSSLPNPDPVASEANAGYLNTSIFSPLTNFSHGLGYSNPNATYNFGADITLTPKIVSTTRFGYFFNNYHDFGWPTAGVNLDWQSNGVGVLDNTGALLPTALREPGGTTTAPFDQSYTEVNANKHYQFDEDVAFFKSGWWGTHNIKGGYQYNKLSNVINQHGNLPLPLLYLGAGASYSPQTVFGGGNCGSPATILKGVVTPGSGLEAEWTPGQPVAPGTPGVCAGQYGYVKAQDFATVLETPSGQYVPAVDHNHALFIQDAWTVGHGLTLNLGLRIEKESLPAPSGIGISNIRSINFSWSDKIEPRLGAAWGSANGKMKIFGSYGVTNDVMKLLIAQTSFGAQGYENCTYPLGPDGTASGFANSDLDFTFVAGRACPTGVANVGANFAGGTTPASLTDAKTAVSLIENVNLRPEEPVAPNVKPYRQHEIVAGYDYQVSKNWAFEARYDRRRLDHVIEDASLSDPNVFEIYTIVNPGQGVDKTLNGYANYLTSIGDAYGPGTAAFNPKGAFWTGTGPNGGCAGCPNNPQAVRNYDGLEFRLTKAQTQGWSGMFSYTWSRLWGNYTGLTTTDQIDGGSPGRNSPDTTRSFDEPFYYFAANGKSSDGVLPTDRPNTFKGNVYYSLPWKGKFNGNTTTFGLFQVAYEGSPISSFIDVGLTDPNGSGGPYPYESTYIFGRGNWVDTSTDQYGNITLGTPRSRRTPWFTQTDFNVQHAIKVNHNNERQVLSFNATLTNLLNQHAVVQYWAGYGSGYEGGALYPGGQNVYGGAAFYQAAETGYSPQALTTAGEVVSDSFYGQPNQWQVSRSIRLGAQFTW